MIEDVHIEDDLPIPAATGWQEMHALLNKEMPVRKYSRRFVLFSLIPIAAMLILFLSVSIRLNHDYFTTSFYYQTGNGNATINILDKENKNLVSIERIKNNNGFHKIWRAKNDKAVTTNTSIETRNNNSSIHPVHLVASPEKSKPFLKQVASINLIDIPVANTKPSFKKWSIYAGAAVNIATAGNQNFQPYPAIDVRYYLSPRVFVSSGLSLFSPAQGTVSAVSKIVPVNDVLTNTSEYNEITSYSKMLYADLPIKFGVQLNKNIAIEAGLQSSLLLSKKTSVEKIAYDFQMNRIDPAAVNTSYAPAAMPVQTFEVKTPVMDYRFISGMHYQIRKTSVGLYYQHSIRKATIPANNLISLHLSWQLK